MTSATNKSPAQVAVAGAPASDMSRAPVDWQKVFNVAPAALFRLNESAVIEECNEQLCELTGYSGNELRGMPVMNIVDESGRSLLKPALESAKLTGHAHSNAMLLDKKGSHIPCRLRLAALLDEKNESNAIVGLVDDLSALRETTSGLKMERDHFELACRRRDTILKRAGSQLEDCLGRLRETLGSPKESSASEAVQSLSKLAEEVATFWSDAEKEEVLVSDFDARELFDACLVAVNTAAVGAPVEGLASQTLPPLLSGRGDLLRRLLEALLRQASMGNSRGTVLCSLVAEQNRADEACLKFSLSVPAPQPSFLEWGLRQTAASSPPADGLAKHDSVLAEAEMWLRRALEILDASLCFATSPNGTQASLKLEVWFAKPSHTSALPEETPDCSKMRLLVVEPDAGRLGILEYYLALSGCSFDLARSAPAGLRKFQQAQTDARPYDLVFASSSLPEVASFELTRYLFLQATLNKVRIVLLAPSSLALSAERLESEHIAACLSWPIRRQPLLDVLAQVRSKPVQAAVSATGGVGSAGANAKALPSILVAEDHPINTMLIIGMIEKLGHKADTSADGVEALAALQRKRYDVILMDCHMPRLDGFETARKIVAGAPLAQGQQSRPYIIAVTANAMPGDRELCLQAGMDDYISKPVRLNELAEALQRAATAATRSSTAAVPTQSAKPSDGRGPVLDSARLDEIRELEDDECKSVGKYPLLESMVGKFLEEIPIRIRCLTEALSARDARKLAQLAHSMKGTSASLGGVRVAAIAHDLEKLGKAGALDDVTEHLKDLAAELENFAGALREDVKLPVTSGMGRQA
jgi:PAS domain S-box-containing protein